MRRISIRLTVEPYPPNMPKERCILFTFDSKYPFYLLMDEPTVMVRSYVAYDVGSEIRRAGAHNNRLLSVGNSLCTVNLLLIRELIRDQRASRNVMGKRRSP